MAWRKACQHEQGDRLKVVTHRTCVYRGIEARVKNRCSCYECFHTKPQPITLSETCWDATQQPIRNERHSRTQQWLATCVCVCLHPASHSRVVFPSCPRYVTALSVRRVNKCVKAETAMKAAHITFQVKLLCFIIFYTFFNL